MRSDENGALVPVVLIQTGTHKRIGIRLGEIQPVSTGEKQDI